MKKKQEDIIREIIQVNNISNKKAMIEKYIGDDEQSRKEFDAYLDVWEKSADLKDFEKVDTAADWMKVRSRMKMYTTRKRIPLQNYLVRIAAVLVLAVALAVFLNRLMRDVSTGNAVYTEIAANDIIRTVDLEDGTVVTLNQGAKIIHNDGYGDANRDIILEGEAFFDVARNESLPFKVHTLNSTIEVLGTRFDVKSDSLEVVVGVVSGKVALYESNNSSNRVELLADNTGYFNAKDNLVSSDLSFDPNRIAWQTHQFVFRKVPLQEVCQILADFYDLKLIKGNNIEINESVTVTCSTESLEEVLYTVNNTLLGDVKIRKHDKNLIVTKL